ncbi:MAG TPA: hypothetical protein VMT08_19940 [Bradyrhizobium sp.]|nr:hypothetical protein [Bradyrhizobium sp.]
MDALVPVVAAFGVAIAFLQWWAARHKLNIDLFEKRYQVYVDLQKFAAAARDTKRAELSEFGDILTRAKFLFGDDVLGQLNVMHNSICGIKSSGFPNAGREIFDIFLGMDPLFKRYMKLTYKLPNAIWEFPRARPRTMQWRFKI